MPKYKCDACGNCTCYSEPDEDWGVPNKCLYENSFPQNWKKVVKDRKEIIFQGSGRRPGNELINVTKRHKLCPKCKEKGIRSVGVKDTCPMKKDLDGNNEICYCCDSCRQACADDL